MDKQSVPLNSSKPQKEGKMCGPGQEINIYLQGPREECLPVLNGVELVHLQEKLKYASLIRKLSERLEEVKNQLKNNNSHGKRRYSCVSIDDSSASENAEGNDEGEKEPLFKAARQSQCDSASSSFLSLPDLLSRFKELEEKNSELKTALQSQWNELREVQDRYNDLRSRTQTASGKEMGDVSESDDSEHGQITVIGH